MAIVKRYNLKGLATKIDDLYKDPEKATDCLNVYKDCSGRIVGRKGVNKYLSLSVDDMHYSREKSEHYVFTDVIKKSSDGITFSTVPKAWTTGSINKGLKSFSEINGYLYFSDTELIDPVMRYDGYTYYQAGIPELPISANEGLALPSGPGFGVGYTAGSVDTYVKMALARVGVNGEVTFGPTSKITIKTNGSNMFYNCKLMKDINSANSTKFYEKTISESAIVSSITGGVITFTGTLATNYVAGDFIGIMTSMGDIVFTKITNVDAPNKKIYIESTVTATSIYAHYFIVAFTSYDDVSYKFSGSFVLAPNESMAETHTLSSSFSPPFFYAYEAPSIEEFLDPADGRYEPIKCKYIGSFNGKLVCVNLSDEVSSVVRSTSLPYSICFSSNGEGSDADTVNYSNILTIGSQDEGECIGVAPVGANMAVFKSRASHIVTVSQDGEIGRIIKVSSTVGCASNKSIINFDDACCWLSDKGVFALSKTSEPEELTSDIENIFTDNPYSLTFGGSRVAIDRLNELLYFYCPHSSDSSLDRTLVYSYKYKEWFFFDGIDGSNGFYDTGNGLYFNDSTSMRKIDESLLNDIDNIAIPSVSTAIEKWYKSGWENSGQPALEKKFNNVVAFSVQNPVYSYAPWKTKMFSDFDWNTSTREQCDDEKSFSVDSRRAFFNVDNTTCYSRRFEFYNNNINETFELSGYEFEVIQTQQRMRD